MPDPLVTPAELKTYLQRPINEDAAALATTLASAAVRTYCGWDLAQVQEVFTVSGNDSRVLSLPTLHLLAVDILTVDGEVTTDFQWSRRGQLYRSCPWPDYTRITADCLHGYAPIPDVAKVVTLAFAARHIGNPERFRTAAVGSVSRTFDLTPLDEALLHPFRIFTTS